MRLAIAFLVLLLAVVICLAEPGKDEASEPQDHTINVSIDGNPCFALPVSVEVTYRNNGDAPWTFNTPTHSKGASILYRIVGTDGLPSGYTLGPGEALISYGQRGGRIVSMTAPPRELRTLEPGQSFAFTVPLQIGWTGHVTPAKWTVWISDLEQKLESNRFELPLRFTRDSVTACLEIASDTRKRGSERAWHAEWLQRIMPGLELNWRPEDTSPEGIARRNAEIEKKLQEFRLFLEDPRNAEAIQQAIGRINQEACLPVEQKAEEAEP